MAEIRLDVTAGTGPGPAHDTAEADYDQATPLLIGAGKAYEEVTGSAFGAYYAAGPGHLRYKPGPSSEEESVYSGSTRVSGPSPVTHKAGTQQIVCTRSAFTTSTPTPGGTVAQTFHRTS